MNLEEILKVAAAILASVGGAGAIVVALSAWLGRVWANRLMEGDKAKHAYALEQLRADLTKANQSLLEADRAKYTREMEELRARLSSDSQNALESVRAGYNRQLEELRAELNRANTEFGAENKARRDYEYEARKRLYEQCEPLLFQLVELAENGLHRIYSLARTASHGNLSSQPKRNWLSNGRNYYMASTVYNLLVPLVMFRLIQRNLTLVDLTVDPHINAQYLLVKQLYISFTDDYKLAKIAPRIDYDPNEDATVQQARDLPGKYIRQAMFFGELDSLVDNLMTNVDQGALRYLTYGEFEARYYKEDTVAEPFEVVAAIFRNFHPLTKPVLWRILIAQAHIYEALIRTRELKLSTSGESITPLLMPISDRSKFDWRDASVNATDDEVLHQPFDVAETYLRKHLGPLFEIHK